MILVTGASGLVGTELVHQLLRSGQHVRILIHRKDNGISHPFLSRVKGDLLDVPALVEAMQGVEKVFHCAAVISFDPRQQEKMFKVNVEGTANVVNAALAAGVKKLVHVSSVAALERMQEDGVVTEESQWTPGSGGSFYGKTKYLAELEVFRGIEEGLPAAMVNPSIILGPADLDSFSTGLFKTAYNNFRWYTEGSTGFVDVRDVVRAMIMLMESDVSGEKFILNGRNESFRKVFEMIALQYGKQPPQWKAGRLATGLIWRLEKIKTLFTGKDPLITAETARAAHVRVSFSNAKLLSLFPTFTYTSLEQTIQETSLALLPQLKKS
jgi:nucleoside-diphosphate-sugar epimerase